MEKSRSWVIQLTADLDKNMEASLSQAPTWPKRSIYKLPECVTKLNPNAYKPQVVSLGPYHHGQPHLKPMEEHKWRSLRNFMKRAPAGKTSRDLISVISEELQQLKDCYDSLHNVKSDEDFVKLMIVDGCFMVEVMRIGSSKEGEVEEYDANDPIFSMHGKVHSMPFIRRDMLMLENQLPILVLYKLVGFQSGTPCTEKDSSHHLILNFFSQPEVDLPKKNQFLHVLDVYRTSLTHPGPSCRTHYPRVTLKPGSKDTIIRSATELDESGIKLHPSNTNSLQDISFNKGVLRFPIVTVDDTTETMFLNLLAFERLHVGAGNQVSTYIVTMNDVIDNERDVALLHSSGIVRNAVGCDKKVAELFHCLSRDVSQDESSELRLVQWSVNAYSRQPWNKWRAYLIKTYFRNPWVTISLIAAIFLFTLTTMESATNFFPVKGTG